ncbi:MAG: peptide-methionine (S)-S-oxide reductase MsrA [Spirochaetales bacterium]|nr:peptide-methionine (S)-S-oxide reductase MsrA [Spirochaetales bacterium]
MKHFLLAAAVIMLTGPGMSLHAAGKDDSGSINSGPRTTGEMTAATYESGGGNMKTAVFAGGCFWGVERVFELLKGVDHAESGYSGGAEKTATYRQVSTGMTGHAESVRVVYDPDVISYTTLLEIFFTIAHDPTQLNFQGPDVGTQYRSIVFYLDDEQKKAAEQYIRKLESEKVFAKPIVTEITAFWAFYPAEDYHQDFMRLNPGHPYIACWDTPKIDRLFAEYPGLIDPVKK